MKCILVRSIAAAFAMLVALPAAKAKEPSEVEAFGWRIGPAGEARLAKTCIARKWAAPRIALVVALTRDNVWSIRLYRIGGFGSLAGSTQSIELRANGATIMKARVSHDDSPLAELSPSPTPTFIRTLRTLTVLEIVHDGRSGNYDVAHASRAIDALQECAKRLQGITPLPAQRETKTQPTGSAFFVTASGFAVTNAHVVRNCKSITLERPGYRKEIVRLVDRNDEQDLALLKANEGPLPPVALMRNAKMGEPVAVFGFPLANILPSSGNFTLGHVSATAGLRDNPNMLQISAAVQPGNSGGPLMDFFGNIVGVVTAKLNAVAIAIATNDIPQNVNFAIKGDVLRAFLIENGVPVNDQRSEEKLEATQLAEYAKSIAAFVRCDS